MATIDDQISNLAISAAVSELAARQHRYRPEGNMPTLLSPTRCG